jgi:hypothetical protein
VDAVHGRYGEYKVLVDGDTVIDGGAFVVLGVVPSARKVLEAVRARLASRPIGGQEQAAGAT